MTWFQRLDSRSVEEATGVYIALLSFWCWWGQWFGGFLPNVAALHGYEWVAAVVGVTYGIFHVYKAHTGTLNGRAMRCLIASGFFMGLGTLIFFNKGLEPPAFPVLFAASCIQGSCFLRIRGVV